LYIRNEFAFIKFDSYKNANKALDKHGSFIGDNKCIVDIALPYEKEKEKKKNGIFLSNTPDYLETDKIRSFFEKEIRVNCVNKIVKNRNYMMVYFYDDKDKEKTFKFDNKKVGNYYLDIYPLKNLRDIEQNYEILVSNIPRKVKKFELKKLFSKCGKILRLSYKIGYDCFICFENEKAFRECLKLNKKRFKGQKIVVKKYYLPKPK
jgi:RNA recognition motif-containing protein